MNLPILIFISLILSYILGAIPFGIVINKLFGGPDLKTIGSGSSGTTNVYRASGAGAALLTLLSDAFKGVIAIILATSILEPIWVSNFQAKDLDVIIFLTAFSAGFVALLGHCFSPFLKFNGGKAVATSAGMIFYLNPNVALITLLVWLLIFTWKRYVSLASIISAFSYPAILYFLNLSKDISVEIYCFLLLAIFILIRHKDNVKRLLDGNENKIIFSKKKT